MTRHLTWIAGLALAVLVCLPSAGRANTIGPTNCGPCNGNSYTLTYFQSASQLDTTAYTIQLLINAAGYNAGGTSLSLDHLMAVAPNIPGWSNAVLTAAPGGVGDWTTESGGLNAKGCDGAGAPFFCSSTKTQASFNETLSSNPLAFTWTINDASLPTGDDAVALKVQFENSKGNKVGSLLSVDMTLTPAQTGQQSTTPEPADWILLATGMAGLALLWRRRAIA